MRGHTESVNAVQFLPYSNILLTCSADKTVFIWDARTVSCLFRRFNLQHTHAILISMFPLNHGLLVVFGSFTCHVPVHPLGTDKTLVSTFASSCYIFFGRPVWLNASTSIIDNVWSDLHHRCVLHVWTISKRFFELVSFSFFLNKLTYPFNLCLSCIWLCLMQPSLSLTIWNAEHSHIIFILCLSDFSKSFY